MTEKRNKTNPLVIVSIIIVVIVALVVGTLIGHALNKGNQLSQTPTTLVQNTSSTTTIVPTNTTLSQNKTLAKNNTVQVVKEVLYVNKTVSVPAPKYNLYYNYVTGCYWIDGSYNFSFYAPYAGYVVFNETNTGIPNNFTEDYFSAYISKQPPLYFKPQPYNETSFCPGTTFLATINPWTSVVTFNNQTTIIPVKNGTNYIIFYNGNANQEHDVNPFPINVTFSMAYYGFKGISIPNPANTTTSSSNGIHWGNYQNTP